MKKNTTTRRAGRLEAPASRETFPQRTRKPGAAGLANEARPGLGSRAQPADPARAPERKAKAAETRGKPRASRYGYEKPRPAPRDQPPDTMAHEQERQTAVSGQSSGT